MAETEPSKQALYKNETLVTTQPVHWDVARLDLATLGVRPTEPSITQFAYRALIVAGSYVADQYRLWPTRPLQVSWQADLTLCRTLH
jgi:hypothetical protein